MTTADGKTCEPERGFDKTGTLAASLIATDIGASMLDVNASAYLRMPFVAADLRQSRDPTLRVAYNDGFVAYLNGVVVAVRNASVAATGGTLADSLADWTGTDQQGFHNWYYGWYDASGDPDGTYDPHTDFDSTRPRWSWNGAAWVLGPANPPWDTIAASSWLPNGNNSGGAHWPIRRWISSAAGTITCRIAFAKENVTCGSGATLRVLQNGIEQFHWTVAFNDATGVRTNLALNGIQEGDYIEFALDPAGTDGKMSDACDGSLFSVVIDQSPSDSATWNSTSTGSRDADLSGVFEEISLSRHADLLIAGTNILTFHALNDAADDPQFLILLS